MPKIRKWNGVSCLFPIRRCPYRFLVRTECSSGPGLAVQIRSKVHLCRAFCLGPVVQKTVFAVPAGCFEHVCLFVCLFVWSARIVVVHWYRVSMILYHMFGPSLSAVQQRQGLIARTSQPNCSYDDVHLSLVYRSFRRLGRWVELLGHKDLTIVLLLTFHCYRMGLTVVV